MFKQFNTKIVISSYDYDKTLLIWAKVREFLKRELGEQTISGAFCKGQKAKNNLYYGNIYLNFQGDSKSLPIKEEGR